MAEAKATGTSSGGPIRDFSEGWARLPFIGSRAHYWTVDRDFRELVPHAPADVDGLVSLCGVFGTKSPRVPALFPGNHPLCKRCMAKAPRWTTKEERTRLIDSDPAVRALFR